MTPLEGEDLLKLGLRFSIKAAMPSFASALPRVALTASRSATSKSSRLLSPLLTKTPIMLRIAAAGIAANSFAKSSAACFKS